MFSELEQHGSQGDAGYIDSHCHFDFAEFDQKREQVWQECNNLGIHTLIIPGIAPEQWRTAGQISRTLAGVFYTAGIHPWWIANLATEFHQEDRLRLALMEELNHPRCVAIGECGLDKAIPVSFELQQRLFHIQVRIAAEIEKPLIIHCVKAHNELLVELKKYRLKRGGVIHGFSGSMELAQQYWALGFYLGIGGTITYERANKTRATVKHMPLAAILLETDAPAMPLHGYQGQPNSPALLPEIAQTLAIIRGETRAQIAQQTSLNAKRLFGITNEQR